MSFPRPRPAAPFVIALGMLGAVVGCSHDEAEGPAGQGALVSPAPSTSAVLAPTAANPSQGPSEDEIISQPFPSYESAQGKMQPVVLSSAPPMALPTPTATSPAGVPTGFPRTPEGALAQLKAMDETGFRGMNSTNAQSVYRDSFETVDPTFYSTGWIGGLVAKFEQNNSEATQGSYTADFTATQGIVRGTARNGDIVVACIVGKGVISGQHITNSGPWSDCQVMHWTGKRWMAQPRDSTSAPNVSPGSAEAYRLGFRDLRA